LIENFFDLKKYLDSDYSNLSGKRIALLSDTASQFMNQAIKANGIKDGLNLEIYESNYNQIEKELLIPSSGVYLFKPDIIIIAFSAEKLYLKYCATVHEGRRSFSDDMISLFSNMFENVNCKLKSSIIFFNFHEVSPQVYGNYSNKLKDSFLYQVRKINYELMELATAQSNLFILDINFLVQLTGYTFVYDPKLHINADMVYSLNFMTYISNNVCAIILSIMGRGKKCLILDLDNTLWGGVIGDDGLENIQIGTLGIGKAFTNMQIWIRELKQRGILLVVCSKNNEETAKEPFNSHPEMILHLDDFALFIANWKSKADNIEYIQQTLNIGLDSMVFLDDSPVEREQVRNRYPEISVPELPSDPAEYLVYLNKLNLFETSSITEEDLVRTKQYKEESHRVQLKQAFQSEEEFFENLEMFTVIESINELNLSRIVQLFLRTNQFNLRTIRYTGPEVMEKAENSEYLTFGFRLRDKFGDYGLVSAIIGRIIGDELFIENWVMSCRVLNRGFEKFIINHLVEEAKGKHVNKIAGEYLPRPKNKIVKDLYKNIGFKQSEGNKWILDISTFSHQVNFIKKEINVI
jgi:FkbH-like protein